MRALAAPSLSLSTRDELVSRSRQIARLPVRPGTDAALALAIAGVMIEQGWFDANLVREWTNGPFLAREDDGTLLRAEALAGGAEGFVAWDEGRGRALRYNPTPI